MRKREHGSSAAATRLVYSTGGQKELVRPAASPSTSRSGGGKGIRLRIDARPGGRVVTLVLGLPGTDDDIAAIARVLKATCGAGGTIKDGVVELQGDHRAAAQAALAARGLKARI